METTYGSGTHAFSLATGSPGELGLIAALAGAFARRAAARATWVKAGTGESLRLLRERLVDMALVHAPAQVEQAVAAGWASMPTPFGANRYCLLGPRDDPAGVCGAADAVAAFRRIAASEQPFVSRGDDSGTHHKELALWQAAGIRPQAERYIVARDFMTACLKRANAARAYFLCDSSTWVAERAVAPQLAVLFDGDPAFVNRYHALVVPPGATPGRDTAAGFARFLVSADGQAILRDYGKAQFGRALYEEISA
ncbi:solute-binding protein [Caldichromatium japonicum]|uniref:Solute-binding protein n=1 Tax=Caldichromatium japonicum TaxID=2699430 RepID=A0A6G7VEV0_9GAMM|nr:substrate-binding domain-containing protein [Caldichromatium japonicum]QIK38569.1 solute-binding protein [Caldichromatium japonicum]